MLVWQKNPLHGVERTGIFVALATWYGMENPLHGVERFSSSMRRYALSPSRNPLHGVERRTRPRLDRLQALAGIHYMELKGVRYNSHSARKRENPLHGVESITALWFSASTLSSWIHYMELKEHSPSWSLVSSHQKNPLHGVERWNRLANMYVHPV